MSEADLGGRAQKLDLGQAAKTLLEECRMVLPGIQALFGFQLMVVFQQTFDEKLSVAEQRLHLVAITLIASAIALVMAPAAYHRQTDPEQVSAHFIHLSSALLLWSMLPLALGICLDFYLIARLITSQESLAIGLALLLLFFFFVFWIGLPWRNRSRDGHGVPQ